MRDIFVTNHNDFHHSDSFDGEVFDFPPKERVAVPVDAATHMFGYSMPDKTDVLHRLGWSSRYNAETKRWEDNPEGVKRLARFVFTRAVMVEETIPSDDAAADALV